MSNSLSGFTTTNTLIVSDFDRTLTKAFVDGKVTSLISTMVRENIFDEDYNQKAKTSYEHYRPIEIDESLPLQYRIEKMQEWWEYVCQVLIEKKLSKDKIRLAMQKSHSILREGAQQFFSTLQKHGIPLVILSANGLGTESIHCYLEENGLNYDNIHVFSNQFIWNKDGVAIDYRKPLVHSLNKDFSIVKQSPLYQTFASRTHVIALGDNISDLDMVKNCPYRKLYKIGFLNESMEELRPHFYKKFDLVIENDGSFDAVNSLLATITNHS